MFRLTLLAAIAVVASCMPNTESPAPASGPPAPTTAQTAPETPEGVIDALRAVAKTQVMGTDIIS